MTNFEELLNIKLNEDKYVLARIVIDYFKRAHEPIPDWAIRVDAEGRRKAAEKAAESAQEARETNRAAKVRKRKKSAVRPSEDDLGAS
ncbi:hypothetical protein LNAOJCKE_0394 [Methylorubrum aminovorans]|uniref:Uncharacterized protein n=1 Tax=Methylorubrum aminovorans TaxID=269069 RepID=A0ABQ4UBQ2_9HYPH|nr:hypothetical protein [Methylorubrum aminovorans]GJE63200.1 hypothetical protein LNAOJCKE_0394 [Methylorubrum aminovorans]GMA79242.1 hypothetical protein GCM10025880_56590 [Methylorubrum aminovorans]